MGYLLTSIEGPERPLPAERRAETALQALEVFVSYLPADDRPRIHDDEEQPISLPVLLALAQWESGDPAHRQRLIAGLADYVGTILRPWEDRPQFPHPPDHYWREAGRAWARDFERPIPQALLDELDRRYTLPRLDELRAGVNERLPRHVALPTTRPGRWGVWDNPVAEFRNLYVDHDVARAHADALNVGRPWSQEEHLEATGAESDGEPDRRAARARWAQNVSQPPPASPPQSTPRSGRQLS